jgi:hypothetical protein
MRRKYTFTSVSNAEMVDMRQLDDVLFHEDHVQRPDFNTAARNGSENRRRNKDVALDARLRDSPAQR